MDLHIHQKGDLINSANIKPHGAKDGEPLTNYEACMADLYAGLLKKKNTNLPRQEIRWPQNLIKNRT